MTESQNCPVLFSPKFTMFTSKCKTVFKHSILCYFFYFKTPFIFSLLADMYLSKTLKKTVQCHCFYPSVSHVEYNRCVAVFLQLL